jgi:hypothetical protein
LASGSYSVFASLAETAPSAADTLLFPLDALLHDRGGARKFAHDFAERRARRFLLAERGQRLPEAQERVRGLRGGFIFCRNVEEGFGGVAVLLALEQAFAEPIGGVAGEPIVGYLLGNCGCLRRRSGAHSHRRGRIRRAVSAWAAASQPRRRHWDCGAAARALGYSAATWWRYQVERPRRVPPVRRSSPARRLPSAATAEPTWSAVRRRRRSSRGSAERQAHSDYARGRSVTTPTGRGGRGRPDCGGRLCGRDYQRA